MRKFEKLPLTIEEQIELLKQRGLIFEENPKIKRYFENISYYRLSAYWFTFLEIPQSEHKFKLNSQSLKTEFS